MTSVRRSVLILVAIVLLVVALVVAADRYVLARTEDRIAGALVTTLDVSGTPEVMIRGFPFLTQLVAGEITTVDVRASGMAVEGVQLEDLAASARGVVLGDPVVVGDVDLAATLSDGTLATLIAEQVPALGDPRVATTPDGVVVTTEMVGLPLTITAVPDLVAGDLVIGLDAVSLAGAQIDPDLVTAVLDRTDALTVELPRLPPGIHVAALEPEAGGVRLVITGTDVPLVEGSS